MAKKPKKLNKKPTPLLIAAAVAIAVTLFFGIRQIMIVQEKSQFEAAAVNLKDMGDRIQQQVGKADETTAKKSCGYASAKFSKGRLGCAASYGLLYKDVTLEEARKLMLDIIKMDGVEAYESSNTYVQMMRSFETAPELPKSIDFDVPGLSPLGCSAGVNYPANNGPNALFHKTDKNDLEVDMACGDDALTEHYPVGKE